MHTEKREDPLVDMGYEIRDVNYKGLRTAVIIFFGFSLFAGVVGYVLYAFWANPALYRTEGRKVSRILPDKPDPLLQDNVRAKTDIMDMRQREDKALANAPIQLEDGTYQIPIEAAKELVVTYGAKTSPTEPLTPSDVPVPVTPQALPPAAGTGEGR